MSNEPLSPPAEPRRLHAWIVIGLCAVTLAVFAGASGHDFVHYDDRANIYNNPHLKGLSWEGIQWMFTDTSYTRRYMPLGWLSYAVDQQFFGLSSRSYHVGNLLLHALNAVLLFFFLRRVLVLARWAPLGHSSGAGHHPATASWCAALGALLWAVHPLRVETVAWASSRIYGVVFAFTMLWLLAWMRAHDPDTQGAHRRIYYGLSIAAFAASLLTYPLAIFAPVVLIAMDVLLLRRLPLNCKQWWGRDTVRIWRDHVPFFALGAGALILTLVARMGAPESYRPATLEEFGLFPRGMQALYVWAYYLWKPWAPVDLSATYSALHAFEGLEVRFILSACLVVVTSGLLVAYRRRFPGALALWICHLLVLIPALGLSEYPHSTYDRYSLLPAVLWSVALGLVLQRISFRPVQAYAWGGVGLTACLAAAFLSWKQVPVWRDTLALYRHMVARLGEHPSRSRFDEVLGVYYRNAGMTNDAIASLESAIRYESRRADRKVFDEGVLRRAHLRLGDVLSEQRQHQEALVHYQAALQLDLTSVGAVIKLGNCLAELNRHEEALANLREAVRMQPQNEQAHQALAAVLRKLGREEAAVRVDSSH